MNQGPATPRRSLAATRAAQCLGAAILGETAWQATAILADLPRYHACPTFWLEVGRNLSVWLPCSIGGIGLVRGRPSGFLPLFVVVALILVRASVVFFPSLVPLLGPPPVGELFRLWPTWLAILAFLALFALLARLAFCWLPEEPFARPWLLSSGLGLLFALCMFLLIGCRHGRLWVEVEASQAVRWSNAAFEGGHQEEALEEWSRVIDRYPHTSAWGVALFNTGRCLLEQQRPLEAIACFRGLLDSGLDDSDYLMAGCEDYRHQACVQLSLCYEELGDRWVALRYAVLARDRYPSRSGCGTCREEERTSLNKRIKLLGRADGP